MGATPSKSVKELGNFSYGVSCPRKKMSPESLLDLIKAEKSNITLEDLKNAGIKTAGDVAKLARSTLTKLDITKPQAQAAIMAAFDSATQNKTCSQIEDTIDKARESVSAGMAESKKVYEEKGAIGVANLTKNDMEKVTKKAAKEVKSATNDLVTAIGTKQMWFAAASALLIGSYIGIIYVWNPLQVSSYFPVLCTISLLLLIALATYGYNWIGNTLECGTEGENEEEIPCKFAHEATAGAMVYAYLGKALAVLVTAISLFIFIILIASLVESMGLGTTAFRRILLVFIAIGAFTAMYSASEVLQKLVEQPIKPPTIGKLIARLVFYIPCLIMDGIEVLKKEYEIKQETTWIILGIEILLVAMYFLVPMILEFIVSFNTSKILGDPIYLDHQEVHGTYEALYNAVKRDGDYVFDKADRYIYTISAWFRINPTPASFGEQFMQDACILSFGDRPRITYNNSTNTLKVRCKLSDQETVSVYETDAMPVLHWNNIAITYDGATMTTFLNGELVGSQINIAPLLNYDLVISGQDKGLEGGIRDINFSRRVMTPGEIRLSYKSKSLVSSG